MSFRDEDDTTTVQGLFQRESDKAVLIETLDGEDVWIPKSCCDDAWDGLDRGDPITLEVATWFAEKEGL
jgi:hypothetical protein